MRVCPSRPPEEGPRRRPRGLGRRLAWGVVVQVVHGCVDDGRAGDVESIVAADVEAGVVEARAETTAGSTPEDAPAWTGLEVEHWLPGPARGSPPTEAR